MQKCTHTQISLTLSFSLSLPITESYAPRFSPSELISNLYIFFVMTRQHESWGSSISYNPPNPQQRYFLRHGACKEICGTSLQSSFGQSNGQSLWFKSSFPGFFALMLDLCSEFATALCVSCILKPKDERLEPLGLSESYLFQCGHFGKEQPIGLEFCFVKPLYFVL